MDGKLCHILSPYWTGAFLVSEKRITRFTGIFLPFLPFHSHHTTARLPFNMESKHTGGEEEENLVTEAYSKSHSQSTQQQQHYSSQEPKVRKGSLFLGRLLSLLLHCWFIYRPTEEDRHWRDRHCWGCCCWCCCKGLPRTRAQWNKVAEKSIRLQSSSDCTAL